MLDKIKGVDIGDQYVNDKAVAIMVKNIAAVTRKEVYNNLRESPFFHQTVIGSRISRGKNWKIFT